MPDCLCEVSPFLRSVAEEDARQSVEYVYQEDALAISHGHPPFLALVVPFDLAGNG